MSRGRLSARLDRLERGSPAAQELGREVNALLDQFLEAGGDVAELLPLFGLAEATEEDEW